MGGGGGGGIYSIIVVHTTFGNQHINIVEKISVFLNKVDPSIHPSTVYEGSVPVVHPTCNTCQ
jgi:hypothetical protein